MNFKLGCTSTYSEGLHTHIYLRILREWWIKYLINQMWKDAQAQYFFFRVTCMKIAPFHRYKLKIKNISKVLCASFSHGFLWYWIILCREETIYLSIFFFFFPFTRFSLTIGNSNTFLMSLTLGNIAYCFYYGMNDGNYRRLWAFQVKKNLITKKRHMIENGKKYVYKVQTYLNF